MKLTTALMNFFIVLVLSLLSLVHSLPVGTRDVFVPPVITPAEDDVWIVGQNQTVTWNVTNPPTQITNTRGRIQLRKGDYTLDVILADNFDILLGEMNVTVPEVSPGDDYRVVLFGDSGNWSDQFSIVTK